MTLSLPAIVRPSEWLTVVTLLRRELVALLRKWIPFLLVAAIVLTATYVTSARWPSRPMRVGGFPADELLGGMAFVFLGCAFVVLPGISALTISVEKERETFEQLFLTLIRPGGLLLGKLLNALGFYFLLLIACLPVMGCIFFLTGVDWRQMGLTLGIVSATAFACACGGLMCSAWCRRSVTAVVLSYVVATALSGIWWYAGFILFLLLSSGRSTNPYADSLFAVVSPIWALARMLLAPSASWSWRILLPLAYQILWGLAFLWIARRLLRRPPNPPKTDSRALIDDPTQLERRRKRFPYYLIDPLKRQKTIEDGRNPMLVKELRWGLLTRGPRILRTFYITFIVALLLSVRFVLRASYVSDVYEETVVVFVVLGGAIAVLTPLLLASLLTKEYEHGNMDFLRSTLLEPREIILGKVGAGFLSLAPLLLALGLPLLLYGLMLLLRNINDEFPLFLAGCGTLIACLVFSVGLSTFASTVTRRTTTSLILSYGLAFIGYVGLAGGFILLVVLTGQRLNLYGSPSRMSMRGQSWVEVARSTVGTTETAFLSPLSAFIWNSVSQTGAIYEPLGNCLSFYWLANIIAFAVAGWLLVLYSIRYFARHRMQDE